MDRPYSAFADWLTKFQVASAPIQALWLIAGAVTALGLASCLLRAGWRQSLPVRGGGPSMPWESRSMRSIAVAMGRGHADRPGSRIAAGRS